MASVSSRLKAARSDAGLEILGQGIDPVNPVERVPLQFDAPRYRRMAAHFERLGPHGARMMRQTASLHVNVDFGASPLRTWRFLNAAAPYLTAIFANSSRYAGDVTGHQSYRALVWRELDPLRTGQFPCLDPVEEYLDFALEAPAFLLGREGDPAEPFRAWWNRMGATFADWHEHLTTLFPDVRPRGYLEIRCIDALPLEWAGVPAVLLTGLLRNPDSFGAAEHLLGPPDPELAWLAGEVGLRAPRLGAVARELFEIGLAGVAG
ncbi:MAG: glutamate-cysteine ligase family protein, partial [Gemmatimonadales bacterium]